jgi:hypothetical protein
MIRRLLAWLFAVPAARARRRASHGPVLRWQVDPWNVCGACETGEHDRCSQRMTVVAGGRTPQQVACDCLVAEHALAG